MCFLNSIYFVFKYHHLPVWGLLVWGLGRSRCKRPYALACIDITVHKETGFNRATKDREDNFRVENFLEKKCLEKNIGGKPRQYIGNRGKPD